MAEINASELIRGDDAKIMSRLFAVLSHLAELSVFFAAAAALGAGVLQMK